MNTTSLLRFNVRDINWQGDAWDEYLSFQTDKTMLRKINNLLKEIRRNGYMLSLGRPELLTGDLSGYASVRISQKNRLVFRATDDAIFILQCGGRYDGH